MWEGAGQRQKAERRQIVKYKDAFIKTGRAFRTITPVITGVLLLISVITTAVPKESYKIIFTGNYLTDPLIGAVFGSVAAGNPITSYIIGGELLKEGVSLIAVTAFILAWVTVGIVQLPAEIVMLGRRFSLMRNLVSFIFSIITAVLTVLTLGVL
jgi:uncharacterized membrane protein YraQ (UPF0718 family)